MTFSAHTTRRLWVSLALAAAGFFASATGAMAATTGSVTPLTDVTPGTTMSITLNDPDGTFCNTSNGTNVRMYVNFFNSDNEAVNFTYHDFTYDTSGDTYSWTHTFYFAYVGDGDYTSKNWTLDPRFTCWAGPEVTTGAPSMPDIEYHVVNVTDESPTAGDSVTAEIVDGEGGWCNYETPGSAVVTFTDSRGRHTTIPRGWSAGHAALGSYSALTDETTVPFTVPTTLATGHYTVDLRCVDATERNTQTTATVQFELDITGVEQDLAPTGANDLINWFGLAGLLLVGIGTVSYTRR